ncbi:hypothetical protein HHK36_029967 [Tetracentron sinense]|uniref:EamA domain-containing protein n=1 Tax=Tetracentron sinense TaxID=13715 RepID=A0A834YEC3_TETSI|nr:hypothetical protein HHK36_029967 [Tetracentron sinense]
MASPSTWRWSWKTRSDSATRVSPSCNPSIFSFSFRRRNRRTLFPSFSLDDSSSSFSSSPESVGKRKESVQIGRLGDEDFSILGDEKEIPNSKPVTFGENLKNEFPLIPKKSQKKLRLSFKSLFGKRPLWRRILFASTKVRSIILLNVITIVYGEGLGDTQGIRTRVGGCPRGMGELPEGVPELRKGCKSCKHAITGNDASNIPVLKEVEAIMDPEAFTVVRFAVSAIPFIPFVLRARGDVQTRNAGIELGFWVSLGYLMQALGLITSDAGRASFISLFTVIVVPLLDGMLGAIVPARTWFGALMSVVGVAMLESSGSPPCVGDLFNFLSAVFFGVHMLRTEHISRSTKKENFLPVLGYEVLVVALLSTIWYFIGGWSRGSQEWDPTSWTWTMLWDGMIAFPWIPALYTGVFSTVLCLWVEMAAMCDVSATETAIIYGLEPLWGAGFAWFLLGERWGTTGWIGAALVLGGSLTVQIFGSSSPSKSSENEEKLSKGDHLLVSDKQNGFSTSPIVVSSRKNVPDVLKKK